MFWLSALSWISRSSCLVSSAELSSFFLLFSDSSPSVNSTFCRQRSFMLICSSLCFHVLLYYNWSLFKFYHLVAAHSNCLKSPDDDYMINSLWFYKNSGSHFTVGDNDWVNSHLFCHKLVNVYILREEVFPLETCLSPHGTCLFMALVGETQMVVDRQKYHIISYHSSLKHSFSIQWFIHSIPICSE